MCQKLHPFHESVAHSIHVYLMHFSANINIDSAFVSDSIQSIVLDNCDSIYHIISVSFVSPFIRLWAILPLSSVTDLCCMPVHESYVLCFVCVCILFWPLVGSKGHSFTTHNKIKLCVCYKTITGPFNSSQLDLLPLLYLC